MSKLGIVVCGNSGIDYIDHEYDVPVIRSILFIGQEEYSDFVDITAEDFYQTLIDKFTTDNKLSNVDSKFYQVDSGNFEVNLTDINYNLVQIDKSSTNSTISNSK